VGLDWFGPLYPASQAVFVKGAAMKGLGITGNILRVERDLTSPLDMEFEIACRQLLDLKHNELVIDLTAVTRIVSQYLGALAMTAAEAHKTGRSLTLRASNAVYDVIKQVGFDKLMKLENTGPRR
jgi:anti-anti-sigma regulatory factor